MHEIPGMQAVEEIENVECKMENGNFNKTVFKFSICLSVNHQARCRLIIVVCSVKRQYRMLIIINFTFSIINSIPLSIPSVFHEDSTVPADIEYLLQVLLFKAVFPTRYVGIAPGGAGVAVVALRYFPA